jgi:AcrR family transcriptional regulator
MAPRRVSREAILERARDILARGEAGFTFQALADALGVTKQAIIYWFPTKEDLAREVALPILKAESDATVIAVAPARSGPEAIELFLRALVGFHLGNLGRFRALYIVAQVQSRTLVEIKSHAVQRPINAATSAMYGALEAKLAADPQFRDRSAARQAAVAIHMAGIGLLTMVALADAVDDPLAHGTGHLLDALVGVATGRAFGG